MSTGQWIAAVCAFGAAVGIIATACLHTGMHAGTTDSTKPDDASPESDNESAMSQHTTPSHTPSETNTITHPAESTQPDADKSPCETDSDTTSQGTAIATASASDALDQTSVDHRKNALNPWSDPDPEPAVDGHTLMTAPPSPHTTQISEAPVTIDMDRLIRTLVQANNLVAELKHQVGRIRTAQARAQKNEVPQPTALASYFARGLDEAGLFSLSKSVRGINLVQTRYSKTLYIRVEQSALSWPDMKRVLALESALNRTLFAWEHFVQEETEWEFDAVPSLYIPTMKQCYRFNQALASSITAQLNVSHVGHPSMYDNAGEWHVRHAIAEGIESFRLPQRLSAQFRLNLMSGDVAFVAKYVPAAAFPRSVWSDELGRIVMASYEMREQAASTYAMRIALLLALHAFQCSQRLCHACVAIVIDTPTRHACVLSGDIARDALDSFDLTTSFDAEQVCRALGLHMNLVNGILQEIPQTFSLESERFCPRVRYESVDTSTRILPRFESEILGAHRVCDLAINEHAHRSKVAQDVARELTSSTQHNVHAILDYTSNNPDATVQCAGIRTVSHILDGSLSEADALAFSNEFTFGDTLTRSCEQAITILRKHRHPEEAVRVLTDALAPLDALDVYRDTDTVVWRDFMSYIDRVLYNRLEQHDEREIRLVPDAYYNAQLLMTTALLYSKRTEQALGFARRAQELDPLDMSGALRVVRCLELLDKRQEAADVLKEQLKRAFDLEGVGVCYYRLAFMHWRLGQNNVADACYQKAIVSRASCAQAAVLELQTMRSTMSFEGVHPRDVDHVLTQAGIALAPTEQTIMALAEAAQAATDAEIFPVARNCASLLGALSGDDVMRSIAASFELEPDR